MYLRASEGVLGSLPSGLSGAAARFARPATARTLRGFISCIGGAQTAVVVPNAARAKDPVCLLVWIHGDIIPCCDEGKDALSLVKSTQFPLAQIIADNKRPFVLVAPTVNWNWGSNKVWHE